VKGCVFETLKGSLPANKWVNCKNEKWKVNILDFKM
jgi:hypothetical protein